MIPPRGYGTDGYKWYVIGDIVVTRQMPGYSIADSLWDDFLSTLKNNELRHCFSLTIGSAPVKPTQRKSAAEVLSENDIPATVLTDNRLTRGILTAVSWLGANVRSFSWDELDTAMEVADVPTQYREDVRKIAAEYRFDCERQASRSK
ncbi:MAG: hypothetical protein AAGF11_22620 [Myxococcota bacterium]